MNRYFEQKQETKIQVFCISLFLDIYIYYFDKENNPLSYEKKTGQ